jgi:ribosomal protein S18 acetylase RimI-like enzyme
MMTLESIRPENALVFKAVRLRALQDFPTAFSSTYAKEAQISDEEWFQRSARWSSEGSVGYLAFEKEIACGLVACATDEQDPRRGYVLSMWVDPGYRRVGVGSALIDGIKAWASGRGMRELQLMVTSANPGAIRFYRRLGFRMTGTTGPYPNDPAIIEYEMRLQLSSESA